jgi:SAM-dependent methyltransferase
MNANSKRFQSAKIRVHLRLSLFFPLCLCGEMLLMPNVDQQIDYWNEVGPAKSFNHPVNLDRLDRYLTKDSSVVDLGCGYGRVLGLLFDDGYQNLIGFDLAPAMIAAARGRYPAIDFRELPAAPSLPLEKESIDAVLLFAVLTCVPTNEGQLEIVREIERVLKPGGLLYISDLWLQDDERNRERYIRGQAKYQTYGMFDLPEGVTVRHHARGWIEELTSHFEPLALDNIDVQTMNGNPAKGFQCFCRKPDRLKPYLKMNYSTTEDTEEIKKISRG